MAKKPDYLSDEQWNALDPAAQQRVQKHGEFGGTGQWKAGDRAPSARQVEELGMSQAELEAVGLGGKNLQEARRAYKKRFQQGGDIFEKRAGAAEGALASGANDWQSFSAELQKGGIGADDPWMKQLRMAYEGTADPSGRFHKDASGRWVDVATSDRSAWGVGKTAAEHGMSIPNVRGMDALKRASGISEVAHSQELFPQWTSMHGGEKDAQGFFIDRTTGRRWDQFGNEVDASGNKTGQSFRRNMGVGNAADPRTGMTQSTELRDKAGNPLGPGAGGGGQAAGGGGGGTYSSSAISAPGGQGSDIANLLEGQLKQGLTGQQQTFDDRAKAIMDGMLVQERENRRGQVAQQIAGARARGVKGPALEKIRADAERGLNADYARQKSALYVQMSQQRYADRLQELDRSQKWLDSLRTYSLQAQSNSLQKQQIEGQLALGYANIAAQREQAKATLDYNMAALKSSEEQWLTSMYVQQALSA